MSNNPTNKNNNNITPRTDKTNLSDDLKHFGYLLPTNDEELEQFENIYGTTQVIFPEHLKNPSFLYNKPGQLKVVNKKLATNKKISPKAQVKNLGKNTYFKKLILAAEIANQLHEENTFGRVKFVKLLYLCEELCNLPLQSNYGKYAAGPLDPKSIYSIDAEFKKRHWFEISKTTTGNMNCYRYTPLEMAEEYKKYYLKYYSHVDTNIRHILNLFRKQKTDFCEIVATLFAVWKESLSGSPNVDRSILLNAFYSWSKEKKRFSEKQVIDAIDWMKKNAVIPQK